MNFLGGSVRVGRLFDITIRVHVLFLFYLGFRLFDATQSGFDWKHELFFLALQFGIVLVHEFGHCFGARAVGGDAEDILMWPLGGLAYAHAPMRPWPQFVTVAAGPLVNVIFCLLSGLAIYIIAGGEISLPLNPLRMAFHYSGEAPLPEWIFYLLVFYEVNLFILAFNLLPVFPMDGGQLFQAILWPFLGLQRATILACQVGLVGCALFGYYSLSHGGGMLLFIAIFGGMTCWQRYQAARAGYLVEDPDYRRYDHGSQGGGFWARLFKTRPKTRRPAPPSAAANPNPGAWAEKLATRAQEETELDRILRKVSEHGVRSLSYVERQTLERITRERQQEENDYQRGNRV